MGELTPQVVIFAVLAGITVLGAYKVVTAELVTHAALYFGLVLVTVAGVFVLLNAEFLAMAQILVYVGAVLTVFVFAVMLSIKDELGKDRDVDESVAAPGPVGRWARMARSPLLGWTPLVVSLAMAVLIIRSFGGITALVPTAPAVDNTAAAIGRELFTRYFVPFELASIVLLVAMIGAIILARQEGADQ